MGGALQPLLDTDGDLEELYEKVAPVTNKTTKDHFWLQKEKSQNMSKASVLYYVKKGSKPKDHLLRDQYRIRSRACKAVLKR